MPSVTRGRAIGDQLKVVAPGSQGRSVSRPSSREPGVKPTRAPGPPAPTRQGTVPGATPSLSKTHGFSPVHLFFVFNKLTGAITHRLAAGLRVSAAQTGRHQAVRTPTAPVLPRTPSASPQHSHARREPPLPIPRPLKTIARVFVRKRRRTGFPEERPWGAHGPASPGRGRGAHNEVTICFRRDIRSRVSSEPFVPPAKWSGTMSLPSSARQQRK